MRVTLGTSLAVVFALVSFLIWSTSMPGTSFEEPLPPLDAREARYERTFHIAPEALVRLFNSDPEVVAYGAEYLRITSWNFLASGLVFG